MKLLREVIDLGESRYSASPYFPYFRACAEFMKPRGPSVYSTNRYLEDARSKIGALSSEQSRALLDEIKEKEQSLDDLNPFGRAFREFFDFGRSEDDFEDEDEFDDD